MSNFSAFAKEAAGIYSQRMAMELEMEMEMSLGKDEVI